MESQGFNVSVKELSGSDAEAGAYFATLLADERQEFLVDTWAVEKEKMALERRGKRIDIAAIVGFWIILALILFAIRRFSLALIRAIRALL